MLVVVSAMVTGTHTIHKVDISVCLSHDELDDKYIYYKEFKIIFLFYVIWIV